MIKMVKAKDLKGGEIISTDGLRVEMTEDWSSEGKIRIAGIAHGQYKDGWFHPDDELPVWYDDSDPED